MHPLSNIRVLEFTNYLAGPFCGTQLADLGADVIKIESPQGGDRERLSGPFINGEGSGFIRFNRNKRSIALDLKSDAGLKVARELVSNADIVVQNLRPGSIERLGLGYEDARRLNPGVIYVSASGWGQTGPLAQLPGLDIMAQARGGLISITGPESGELCKVGVPVCDLVCGIYGALAAVAALNARRETGEGQHIDVNLLETGVSLAVWEAARYFATGEVPTPQGSAHAISAPYQVVRAKDGAFAVGAVTPGAFKAFCEVIGKPELVSDPRYVDKNSRRTHRDALIASIESATVQHPVTHWTSQLERAGVPCAPVQTFDQVFNDPHLLEREFFWDSHHPRAGAVRLVGSPMSFSGTPTRRTSAGPVLGAHTTEVLSDLGYPESRIQDLLAANVIAVPEADDIEVPSYG
ncbi:CaiB/BaiF CoA transferase family protein [Spirillospora sp. CA-255316]